MRKAEGLGAESSRGNARYFAIVLPAGLCSLWPLQAPKWRPVRDSDVFRARTTLGRLWGAGEEKLQWAQNRVSSLGGLLTSFLFELGKCTTYPMAHYGPV